jgi:hypothetical protein
MKVQCSSPSQEINLSSFRASHILTAALLRIRFNIILVTRSLDNSVTRHVSHRISGPLTHSLYITSFGLRGRERLAPLLLIREAQS